MLCVALCVVCCVFLFLMSGNDMKVFCSQLSCFVERALDGRGLICFVFVGPQPASQPARILYRRHVRGADPLDSVRMMMHDA